MGGKKTMNKNQLIFPFGFVGLIIIFVLYFVGRASGKMLPPKPIDLSKVNLTPGGYDSNAGLPDEYINELVEDLYKDIKGWTITPIQRSTGIYMTLLRISDVDLMKVLNLWDQKYYSEWKQTLLEAMEGEYYLHISKLTDEVKLRIERLEQNRK